MAKTKGVNPTGCPGDRKLPRESSKPKDAGNYKSLGKKTPKEVGKGRD